MTRRIASSALREYDIRGIVGETLHLADAVAIGRSFGTIVRRRGGTRITVGYDGRTHSPPMEDALVTGLTAAGIDVLRIGLGPTPMLYFAESILDVAAGVMVTGSHNPASHNGFKFVLGHRPFFGPDILHLAQVAADGDWSSGSGIIETVDLLGRYVDRLLRDQEGGAFRIGWDAGNGAAGPVVERLVARLPGHHRTLFTAVDGRFPNHHPDPTIPANLNDLIDLVRTDALDFGVAFDGDGDRIGVVDGEGRVVPADRLLALLAGPVLAAHPGATIVGDVKMSQTMFDRIAALSGIPVMGRAGHAPMKRLITETGALLAGEQSGHIFFADDYPGYDDALYAALRLIRLLTDADRPLAALLDAMPDLPSTPEMRVPCPDATKFALVDAVRSGLDADTQVNTTDGIRVTTTDGWWLLRASNTEPLLVARAEGRDPDALTRLMTDLNARLANAGAPPVSSPAQAGA